MALGIAGIVDDSLRSVPRRCEPESTRRMTTCEGMSSMPSDAPRRAPLDTNDIEHMVQQCRERTELRIDIRQEDTVSLCERVPLLSISSCGSSRKSHRLRDDKMEDTRCRDSLARSIEPRTRRTPPETDCCERELISSWAARQCIVECRWR